MEDKIMRDFVKRTLETKAKYPKIYNSSHEAIGVLLEEFKELQDEVFKKVPDLQRVYDEAIDLSAASYLLAVFLDRKKE